MKIIAKMKMTLKKDNLKGQPHLEDHTLPELAQPKLCLFPPSIFLLEVFFLAACFKLDFDAVKCKSGLLIEQTTSNEDDLKNKDNLKKEDNLKNEDNHKK